jgi:hypothetical protein
VILIFVQQFFTFVISTDIATATECPANSNGCIRVAKTNQYRANNIEMRYPVTFKQDNLEDLLAEVIRG